MRKRKISSMTPKFCGQKNGRMEVTVLGVGKCVESTCVEFKFKHDKLEMLVFHASGDVRYVQTVGHNVESRRGVTSVSPF